MRIIGLDPGLRATGWGVIESHGSRLSHIANGTLKSDAALPLPQRLQQLFFALEQVIFDFKPDHAAVEETFVNSNGKTTLLLGQARAVSLLVPSLNQVAVAEYSANLVKKSVVGNGHAQKDQIQMMVEMLLPQCKPHSEHAADALAIAICHAHHVPTQNLIKKQQEIETLQQKKAGL